MNLKDWALLYAENGYSIFPLKPNDKKPIFPGSLHQATCDEYQITDWWTRFPTANIGLPMGQVNNIVGLDIDYKDGAAEDITSRLEPSYTTKTPTGGLHIMYKLPPDGIKNGKIIEKGVTVRAEGYYFVAPPSIHPETLTQYTCDTPIWKSNMGDCPEWVVSCEAAKAAAIKDIVIVNGESKEVIATSRHKAMCDYATALRHSGETTESEIYENLKTYQEKNCPNQDGKRLITDDELRQIAKWTVEKITPKTSNIVCLGFKDNKYYYTSSSNGEVIDLSPPAHTELNLLSIMPMEYWRKKYGYEVISKTGAATIKINFSQVASSLMQQCRTAGIYNLSKNRGLGCWLDANRLVMHLGDRLIVDNQETDLDKFDSKYIYKLDAALPDLGDEAATDEECQKAISIIESLNWKYKDDAIYFAGFLPLYRLSGALKWRSQSWLTGPSGCGKTEILERIVKPVMGAWAIPAASVSTEAGIRQTAGTSSLPIYFDEAETTEKKSSMRIQRIVEMIRQASSSTEARILKGTPNGKALDFKPNCMFVLASVRVNLIEEQDRNRFIVMTLDRNETDELKAKWHKAINPSLDFFTEKLGDKILVRMLKNRSTFNHNLTVFEQAISEIHDQRTAQQYAPVIAGYILMEHCDKVDYGYAKSLIGGLSIGAKGYIEKSDDEADCLNFLMQTKIQVKTHSVGDTVSMAISDAIWNAANGGSGEKKDLMIYGILAEKDNEDNVWLYVPNNHTELAKIFKDSKWCGGLWCGALKRLARSEYSDATRRRIASAHPLRCVKVLVGTKNDLVPELVPALAQNDAAQSWLNH